MSISLKEKLIDRFEGVPVYAMGEYHPKRGGENPKFDDFSQLILDFKDGKSEAIDLFSKALNGLFRRSSINQSQFVIATVPSSTKGKSHQGFESLVTELSKRYNVVNKSHNLLKRTASIEPAHKGGDRAISNHLSTLQVVRGNANIFDSPVVLLDDVTTTGNSLKAGIMKLQRSHAKVIAAIALGKTVT